MEFSQELQTIFEHDDGFQFEDDKEWCNYDDWFNKYDEIIKIKSRRLSKLSDVLAQELEEEDEVATIISSSSSESESIATHESESVESLTPPCLKKISISDSELKFLNLYTFYPIPEDPGVDAAFWILYPSPPLYETDGIEQFFDLVKLLELCPIRCLKNQLKTDNINLKYYGIDSEIILALSEALVSNPTIKSLNLQDNPLTKDACYHLNRLLIQNHILSSVNLTACKIGAEGALRLVEGVSNSSALKEINLSRCELGNEGFSYIANAVASNTLLQSLNVSNNNLDEGSAVDMNSMLTLTESLEYLNISWNNFNTKVAAEKLFSGLIKNDTLIDVDISWNSMGKESSYHIANFLNHSKNIKHINISANRFTDSEALQISYGVKNSKSLQSIDLKKNPLRSKGVTEFISTFASDSFRKSTLELLDLESFYATKEVIPKLDQLKEIKPDLTIKLAGILENFIIVGPDLKELFFKSANYEAMSPKKKKARKNFGHFVLSLGDTRMKKEKFLDLLKDNKIQISDNLAQEIMKQFLITKKTFDQAALKESYMTYFPDTKLPPPPKSKVEEAEGKDSKKKKRKGKKGKSSKNKGKKKKK